MDMAFDRYRRKVLGCWLGKAVGGTLGGPWEGHEGPLALSFYDPVPQAMLANDDLDLQVVWLEALRRHGLPVDRRTLADAWLEHVHFWPDEYGVACRNLSVGIFPPASGAFDNGFTAGMGSAIRSEIWACLAPGDPELAASLALEDACVDHCGEGLYAEVFLATLQSAAFVESDRDMLLDTAYAAIPADSRVARAVCAARDGWRETGDWKRVRTRILAHHGRQNFTDVAQNLAFIVLGWLAGQDDFGTAICTAVNCGKDTDCTGATLGALLGILRPDGIDEAWLEPIGRELVLSPGVVGMHPAASLDEFTDQVAAMALAVQDYYGAKSRIVSAPDLEAVRDTMAPPRRPSPAGIAQPCPVAEEDALLATDPLVVRLSYPPGIALVPGQGEGFLLTLVNGTGQTRRVDARLRVPDGWSVKGSVKATDLSPEQEVSFPIRVTAPATAVVRPYRNPLDVRLSVDGIEVTVTAGLPLSLPWVRWPVDEMPGDCPTWPATAERVEACGHTQPLPAGATVFAIDVKLASDRVPRWIVQAPRAVRVWLDGRQINEHDGSYRVPAVHRAGPTGADVQAARGWHRLVIAVGAGEDGYLFVGLGDAKTWDWLRDAEFRLPTP